ncbi:hypothetical protein ACFVS2_21275 [Brevibacillus sp. NPDC058079]|uniref:hypothetical protein n=1 Tax=Brevibacillus sp. NPDC058079 TaxID=3346330 RepID=UPI0036E704D0
MKSSLKDFGIGFVIFSIIVTPLFGLYGMYSVLFGGTALNKLIATILFLLAGMLLSLLGRLWRTGGAPEEV